MKKTNWITITMLLFAGVILSLSKDVSAAPFTDNGTTVTDQRTGLEWQKQDDGITRTWQAALDYCNGLSLAGHTDWRLPNIKELESITDDSRYIPAIDPIFTDTQAPSTGRVLRTQATCTTRWSCGPTSACRMPSGGSSISP